METQSAYVRMVTDADVVGLLRASVAAAGSQRRYCHAVGLHESDLSQVLRGRQAPTARQCAAVGVERRLVRTGEPVSPVYEGPSESGLEGRLRDVGASIARLRAGTEAARA